MCVCVVRTPERVSADSSLPQGVLLADLDEFASRNADYIIEVAHPAVVASHGVRFLTHANLIVGSPTALADEGVETALLRQAAVEDGRGLYIPSGERDIFDGGRICALVETHY